MNIVKSLSICAAVLFFALYLPPMLNEKFPPNTNDYYRSVVSVELQDLFGKTEGHGTGVYLGNNKFLTAFHVVDKLTEKSSKHLALRDIDGKVVPAKILWKDTETDVAMVEADASNMNVSAVSVRCSVPKIGEKIEGIGSPLNLKNVHSYGNVAGAERKYGDWKKAMLVDLTMYSGMSGGPIFDVNHQVIGTMNGVVITAKDMFEMPSVLRLGWAVPGDLICETINKHA